MKNLTICSLAFVLFATPAWAAPGNTSTSSGTATATVIAPIKLKHNSSAALNFGKFTTGGGGTVVVAAAGTATTTGEVTMVSGSTPSADGFSVTGQSSRTFLITTTSGTVSANGNSMAFTTAPSANTGTLSTAGTASFTVGGKLTVSGSTPAATYNGSFSVTVAYN